jgi:hypothetical protein
MVVLGGEGLLLEIHPDEQEKRLKYNRLLTNAVAIRYVIDLTRAVRLNALWPTFTRISAAPLLIPR